MYYKDMIMILSSYDCDKNCPYCIAKMEKLPNTKEDLIAFEKQINKFISNGDKFKYFVLSGNGETSKTPLPILKEIKNIVEASGIFEDLRIQTSGNLFYMNEAFSLFNNWLIEITRTSVYFAKEHKILGYKKDYTSTENFNNARLRLNHVLLKDNISFLVDDIKSYFNKYKNIDIMALKILDTQPKYKNKQNNWIELNGISYNELDYLKSILDKNFSYIGYEFNNNIWSYEGNIISLFSNSNYNTDKTPHNLVWYGNKLIY